MRNILKKIIAVWLICILCVGMVPLSGLATEEVLEPVVAEPVSDPVPQPEPEPAPEPEHQSAQEPAPVSEPEPAQESASEPEPQPEPDPEPQPEVDPPVENNTPSESDGESTGTESSEMPSEEPEMDSDSSEESDSVVPNSPSDGGLPTDVDEAKNADSTEPAAPSDEIVDEKSPNSEVLEISIEGFDTSALPQGMNVPYGMPENDLDFPSSLKAVWSDGSTSDVNVSWNCIDDDNGGTEYIPEHENPAAVFTFQAVLEGEFACNAELPIIYIAFEAVAAPLLFEPLDWEDVFVKVDEKEYETGYKTFTFNIKKNYEIGLSLTEADAEQPDSELKNEVDDSLETHNVVMFQNLDSDTEYTVWARAVDTEEWTAFAMKTVCTDAVSAKLVHHDGSAAEVFYAGETICVETNLEAPEYKWYRSNQEEAVSEADSFTLSLDEVGCGIKCCVTEGEYTAESLEAQVLPFAPSEVKLDTASETLTVVFPETVPAGAVVTLEGAEQAVIATAEVAEAVAEFKFENLRDQAGKTISVYLSINGVKGAVKEFAVVAENAAPEQLGQDQIVFAASSQRSIDFSCTDVPGVEFAYGATGSTELTKISGNPEVLSGLSAQTDYTLYMRSAATETGFASGWVESGFNAATDQLEVVIAQADSIYFDSVITAAPARTYIFEEGFPVFKWYFSSEAVFDEKAVLLEDVQGAELNLQEKGFSKSDIGKYIFVTLSDGYGNISAAAGAQLRRYDDPLLSIDVDERITAGETVTAVFNGEVAEITWQWKRGEENISDATSASYTATAEDAYNVLTVNAIQNETIVASAYVAVDMCIPTLAVDYVKETVAVSVNCDMPDGWTLRAVDENGISVDKNWPKGESSVSYKLADLGIDPNRHDASAPDYTAALILMNAGGKGEEVQITLPTRRDYSEMTLDMSAVTHNSVSKLTFAVPSGLELALSLEGAAAPDFSLGDGRVFNLKEDTQYRIWMRDAAVEDECFASKWMDMHPVKTREEVSVKLKDSKIKWKPNWEFTDFEIVKGDVRKADIEGRWNAASGGNAGKYSLKLELKGEAKKEYVLKEDTLTLTVEPLTMSAKNTRVSCEQLVYNGREQIPQKLRVFVDDYEIPLSEIEIKNVDGFDRIKAGQQRIKVAGKGNYVTGGIVIAYVISVAKPAAISWPTAGYLVTGQKLSESKLTGGSTNAGSFAWENGSIVPAAGISKHNVVFTPADTTNYDWTGVTMVKPVDIKVYSVASPGMEGSTGTDSDYNYDFSASSGYWEGYDFYGGYEEGEAENSSDRLMEAYLSVGSGKTGTDALGIVYDVVGTPMDYELLSIQHVIEGEEELTDHTFMIIAQPDEEGEIVSRILRLNLAQLDYLHKDKDFSNLLFRNGDAELCFRKEELFTGNAGKLASYMLSSGEDAIDLMDLDFDTMEEPVFTRDALNGLWLEARIDPVIITGEGEEEEKDAWDVSLWLCTEYTEVEISTLVPSFTIGLNVNGLFDESRPEAFLEGNGIVLMDENEQALLLESELAQMPGELSLTQPDEADYYTVYMPVDDEVWTDYFPNTDLMPYRNYVLATPYAGTGMYMLAEIEENF